MLPATLASSLVDTNIVTFSQDVFHARKVVCSTTMYLNNHAILHSTHFKPGGGVRSRLVSAPAVLRIRLERLTRPVYDSPKNPAFGPVPPKTTGTVADPEEKKLGLVSG